MTPTPARLTAAALTILLAEGAQAVTMRRVAADAGVTTMATYRHFPNREALLHKTVDDAVGEITAGWATAAAEGDFTTRTEQLLNLFLDFALGKPNLYVYLVAERRPDARQFPDDFRAGGSPAFAPMLDTVARAMRDGALRQDDILEVTLAITSPVVGLLQQYHGGRIDLPEPEFRALCARTVERVLNGLR
ncbi:TetR family transcriptional regulator [Actinosynnema sp. ALI-1.44]|uniref:TetR/AcrR family transcriptional regulator n=1 Tax=Actinosynnema sp. ALI-1.44 TaxID=1933779 RepID=UPI00097C603D|nr:TetR/AcrR family transcriptional regulator [Actinosynnema sp. ALI-1.44]ONI78882.1 TetR family transcriptional regulator [Actinosynnema sp. ALI-1.44]